MPFRTPHLEIALELFILPIFTNWVLYLWLHKYVLYIISLIVNHGLVYQKLWSNPGSQQRRAFYCSMIDFLDLLNGIWHLYCSYPSMPIVDRLRTLIILKIWIEWATIYGNSLVYSRHCNETTRRAGMQQISSWANWEILSTR